MYPNVNFFKQFPLKKCKVVRFIEDSLRPATRPRPIIARIVNCCVSWNGWMPGQGGEGTPCFCLSVNPSPSLHTPVLSFKSSPALITAHSLRLFIAILHPFLPVSLQTVCRSCLCRVLRLINTRIHKIFLFCSFSLSLTFFRRPTHCYCLKRAVVCSSSLVSCTGY